MIDMAAKNNIDLRDPMVIAEFRKIQMQNLEDVKRLKEGKHPLTDEELKNKLQKEHDGQQEPTLASQSSPANSIDERLKQEAKYQDARK